MLQKLEFDFGKIHAADLCEDGGLTFCFNFWQQRNYVYIYIKQFNIAYD